jgi:hypothetical protein
LDDVEAITRKRDFDYKSGDQGVRPKSLLVPGICTGNRYVFSNFELFLGELNTDFG